MTIPITWRHLTVASLALLVVTLLFATNETPPARADHVANSNAFYWMTWYNDYWWNWDFESQTASRTNVDWPVDVIFVNKAAINLVKTPYLDLRDSQGRQRWFMYKPIGDTCGSQMKMYLQDADPFPPGAHWDGDSGIKGGYLNPGGYKCVPGNGEYSVHFRLYADSPTQGGNDMMGYNVDWGDWVMATSHLDYSENTSSERAGWSNVAEQYVGTDAANIWGSSAVSYDWRNFNNYQYSPLAGTHIVQNNGWVTKVRLP